MAPSVTPRLMLGNSLFWIFLPRTFFYILKTKICWTAILQKFSTSHSFEFNRIKNTIEKYLPDIYNDPIYAQVLSKGFRAVSRRAPTIGRTLSPSLYTSRPHRPHWLQFRGSHGCGGSTCPCCPPWETGGCHSFYFILLHIH